MLTTSEQVLVDLAGELRRRWADPTIRVEALEPFGDGHSGETYTVRVCSRTRDDRYVLRLSPPGVAIRGPADVGRQGRIMAGVHASGGPAPEVLACASEPVVAGRSYALIRLVPGAGWAEVAVTWPHRAIATAAVTALTSVQAIPPGRCGLGDQPPSSPRDDIERWAPLLSRCPDDVRESGGRLGAALLRTVDRAGTAEPVLVHGDFHYGNLLFANGQVAAVIDWEIAGVGHPLTDLACLMLASLRRRYADDPNPTGSIRVPLRDLVDLYGADPAEASWHLAACCYKYAAILGYNRRLHLHGKRPDPVYDALEYTISRLPRDGLTILHEGLPV